MSFLLRVTNRFRNDPASIRLATMAIIAVTTFVVIVGALIVWVFDRSEYPTFGTAIWFTLQTVTTVGYGDVTPERTIGRLVAGVVMVTAIGLITVVTAAITSAFIEAARSKIDQSNRSENIETLARLEASMTLIADRLGRLESTLAETTSDAKSNRARNDGGG